MPTTAHGLPYPAPTDPVADGAAAIESLADAVEARLHGGTAVGKLYPAGFDSNGMGVVRTVADTDIGLIIHPANATQSGDLLVVQNSAGAVQAKFDKAGRLSLGANAANPAQGRPGGVDHPTMLSITPTSAQSTPFVIRAVASQADNLTDWQNSAGTGDLAFVNNVGNVGGTGAYTAMSDARTKDNITDLQLDPVDVITRLRPRHFDYIDGDADQVGFVAQEVAAVLPQAVVPFGRVADDVDPADQLLGLRDGAVVAYLVGAVQQLTTRVAELEKAQGITPGHRR